jgi:biopolymer transport protein ExbD/biopolymer transport protein TolR
MGMGKGVGTGRTVSEINVTPLIDVLLVLLIIFMVIVPAAPKGLDTLIPQSAKADHPETGDTIVVEVLANGAGAPSYKINQTSLDKQEIEPRLAAIFAMRQHTTMFVKGDSSLDFSTVAEVIDMGHQAHADTIGLLTPEITSGR